MTRFLQLTALASIAAFVLMACGRTHSDDHGHGGATGSHEGHDHDGQDGHDHDEHDGHDHDHTDHEGDQG